MGDNFLQKKLPWGKGVGWGGDVKIGSY